MPIVVLQPRRNMSPFAGLRGLTRLHLDSAEGFQAAEGGGGVGDAPEPDEDPPVVESSESAVAQADPLWWAIGILLIVIGVWWGQAMYDPAENVGPTFKLNVGFSEFALFYILAQSLERMSEFVSYIPWVGIRIGIRAKAASQNGSINKEKATQMRETSPIQGGVLLLKGEIDSARAKALEGANAALDEKVITRNRAAFFFAFNTAVAALYVGYFEVLMLKSAGVDGAHPWIDIAITALAIGGGTKPLHDLIKNIEKKKPGGGDSTTTVAV